MRTIDADSCLRCDQVPSPDTPGTWLIGLDAQNQPVVALCPACQFPDEQDEQSISPELLEATGAIRTAVRERHQERRNET